MRILVVALGGVFCLDAYSHEKDKDLETILIEGRKVNLLGDAVSASQGIVGQKEIALRPLLRTGEVLELVPGMVATQHSGSGKANQYFLRGFNLDHGTDFATFVDGMPVNMRSHGHGQGYTDLNFLIAETVSRLEYKKGAYYADVGDFSGAGSAHIQTANQVGKGVAEVTLGMDNYQHLLFMNSVESAGGSTLFALEGNRYDGPWSDIDEDISKSNLLLKHTRPISDGKFNVTFMAYDNTWNSADQIPSRAVGQGLIDDLGSIDTSVGGESSRYSLSASWEHGNWMGSAYVIDYQLNLWSNFTYFLDDPVNGDQFEQVDDRNIYGGQLEYRMQSIFNGSSVDNRAGLQVRIDDIEEVGLYHTRQRQRLGVTRSDEIKQSSISLFFENEVIWSHHLRTVLGLRYDSLDFDVTDLAGVNRNGINLVVNSGDADDNLISLKGSMIYSFDDIWEGYLSAGQGFHSNDARGTTIRVDPGDGAQVDTVDPLVRSKGFEVGLRRFERDKLNASIALWQLELDSELLFVGDAGNTEASRPSTRKGVELVLYYYFNDQISADFEYAYSDAEFDGDAPEGNQVPGANRHVLQAGVTADFDSGWFGSLRLRHLGDRPLVEDGSVTSESLTVWNMKLGYQVNDWQFSADLLNLADSNDHDIDYFYESRLLNKPEAEDIHYHVIEPRTVRLSVEYKF